MDRPRLESLTVRDFRSIAGEWTIPLDADVVLIHGHNGAGKTSLLSALELAATGTISHLDRLGDDTYSEHLHHWGTQSGQVTLNASGLPGPRVGSATVGEEGAQVEPLLDSRQRDTFVERCLLPQAILGRLFEVYAPRGVAASQNPLIRFVKEVLGLDALDALIDGLYPAAHVRRIEKLSLPWREALERHERLGTAREEALSLHRAAKANADRLLTTLVQRLGIPEDAEVANHSVETALTGRFAARSLQDSASAQLHELELRLDAIEATLSQYELMSTEPHSIENENELSFSTGRFQEWETTRSGPLRSWFAKNVSPTEGAGPVRMLQAVRDASQATEASLVQISARLRDAEAAQTLLSATRSKIDEIDNELSILEGARERAATSSAAAGLASLLTSILDHVDGNECPVCTQEFVKGGSLSEHIVHRASSLSADASTLLQLERRRADLESQRADLVPQSLHLASTAHALIEEDLPARQRALISELEEIRGLESIGEVGVLLSDEMAAYRDQEARRDRSRSLLASCTSDLEAIAVALGVASPAGLMSQRLAALRANVRSRVDAIEHEQAQLAELRRLHDEFRRELGHMAETSDASSALAIELERVDQKIAEAKRRKDLAADLRRRAETVRTGTVTRVFDEQLNGSWARIFSALVPSEPFVPQFRKIPEGVRQIAVEVQTVHRDGIQGATPAAMLSQGNLNTAALSLFVALHFAGSADLPWLIFDDPVQSMDDLHISNFAALVKQLTRRNGRQVIIAVHERELFEYLAMELAPASPKEKLLTVTLDRTYGRTVVIPAVVPYKPDTAVVPAPAA